MTEVTFQPIEPAALSADLITALHQMDILRITLPDMARGVTERRCRHCGSWNVGPFEMDVYLRKPGRKFECLDCGMISEMKAAEFCSEISGCISHPVVELAMQG